MLPPPSWISTQGHIKHLPALKTMHISGCRIINGGTAIGSHQSQRKVRTALWGHHTPHHPSGVPRPITDTAGSEGPPVEHLPPRKGYYKLAISNSAPQKPSQLTKACHPRPRQITASWTPAGFSHHFPPFCLDSVSSVSSIMSQIIILMKSFPQVTSLIHSDLMLSILAFRN